MYDDSALSSLASRVGRHLLEARRRLVTAESCTGGWIAKLCTDIAGSSDWFDGGWVTYSNAAKERGLGVASATLAAHGAVSEPVVREMALGALQKSGAGVAVAVSGIAGPAGAVPGKPVGTVWHAVAWRAAAGGPESRTLLRRFGGDRDAVRRQAVAQALEMVLQAGAP